MARTKRYYAEDDEDGGMFPPRGITPSQLKRLGRKRQKEYLLHWFYRNFEDPVENTPRDEGDYVYIWGGPYDAKQELFTEFGDLVAEQVIDEVVAEVEQRAVKWAPASDHPDMQEAREAGQPQHGRSDGPPSQPEDLDAIIDAIVAPEAGVKPNYGGDYERALRKEVLERLDKLERALAAIAPKHGGIGHNKPPFDDDDQQAIVVKAAREAGEVIGKELAKSQPDALQVAKAASRLQAVAKWFGGIVAENFAKGFGSTTGKLAAAGVVTAAAANYPPLRKLVEEVVDHIARWLVHVISPF